MGNRKTWKESASRHYRERVVMLTSVKWPKLEVTPEVEGQTGRIRLNLVGRGAAFANSGLPGSKGKQM